MASFKVSAESNTFTVAPRDGKIVVTPGIQVVQGTTMGDAVILGKFPGWERFVRLQAGVVVSEGGNLLSASAMFLPRDQEGNGTWSLHRHTLADHSILVRVETGISTIVNLKERPLHGCESFRETLIDHGSHKSRLGQIVSREYLHRMEESDELEVSFVDRSVYSVRFENGEIRV